MKLKELMEEQSNKITQDTVIEKIKKTLGAENVSDIKKWSEEPNVSEYPSVSFIYNKNNYIATGFPQEGKPGKRYVIHFDKKRGRSLSIDFKLTRMFTDLDVEDAKEISKKIRDTATKLPSKTLRLK
jgi:hypothetical protein